MADRERQLGTRKGERPRNRKGLWSGRIPLETETSWFVLTNLLDLVVTYRMIGYGNAAGIRFGESNPVAAYFLNHWGLKGLMGLKLVVVIFVCLVAQLAYRHKPELARFLLIVGTATVAAIVIYSVRMFFQAQ
jgi:hypothetical protein